MKISIPAYLFTAASLASFASAKNIFDDNYTTKGNNNNNVKNPKDNANKDNNGNNGNKNNKIRRVGKLGSSTSKGASAADCTKDLDVQLFDDMPVIKFKGSGRSCRSGKSFAGSSSSNGRGKEHITLVPGRVKGTFAASVTNDETGAIYSIAPDANGSMTVTERFQEDYGEELDPEDGMDPKERALFETRMMEGGSGSEERTSKERAPVSIGGLRGKIGDLGDRFLREKKNNSRDLQNLLQPDTIIDVMVAWTSKAECKNSGNSNVCNRSGTTEANMRTLIDLAIEETNTAYLESGVLARLNLVHAYYTDYDETGPGFSGALSQLRSTTDGILDDVHAKREQYKADVVALIIDDPQYCGIAYLGPSKASMFSVTGHNCATGYYSFGHEIGHNMGCQHDRGTSSACTNSNYNYGYRDPQAQFRSILAYNCNSGQCDNNAGGGCTRVQRFSNPNYQYQNKPIGSADHDNARRINDVRQTIANYYDGTPPAPPTTPPPTNSPTTKAPTTPPPTNSPTTKAPTSEPTPCVGKIFEVEILTDNYPGETTWTLRNQCANNEQVASGGPYQSSGTTYTFEECMVDAEYVFTLNDSYGDGICCGYGTGNYKLRLDGTEINTATGGSFGSTESTTFGSCEPPPPPTTAAPSKNPTAFPTRTPTTAAPSKNPTAFPTRTPTTAAPSKNPTAFPTKTPTTAAPSKNPTAFPTKTPTTAAPSKNPTAFPTANPTAMPTTAAPTRNPTDSPTSNPTTAAPTPSITFGPETASFDGNLGAPRCVTPGTSCTTGDQLILGRGTSNSNNRELNPSNTLDGCTDGTAGTFHVDESVDRIKVSSVDGGPLQEGREVEIEALVWAYSSYTGDTADFYAAAGAGAVSWTYLGSLQPGGSGLRTFKKRYVLPLGGIQAVRVNFRWQGGVNLATSCSGGNWDDVDDLVFSVLPGDVGDVVPDVRPADVPPTTEVDCKAIGRKDRCVTADCQWKNGRKGGCFESKWK